MVTHYLSCSVDSTFSFKFGIKRGYIFTQQPQFVYLHWLTLDASLSYSHDKVNMRLWFSYVISALEESYSCPYSWNL